jgi:hypothetical protein
LGRNSSDLAAATYVNYLVIGHNFPFVQKHYPFSKIVRFFEIVCREEDGPPELSLVLHGRPKVPASAWIHTGSRLVKDEYLWVTQERKRETKTLLLAAGALAHSSRQYRF